MVGDNSAVVCGGGKSIGDSSIVVSVGGFVFCSHGLYLGLCFWVDRFWITFTCIAMHVQEIYICFANNNQEIHSWLQ